jgi:hypothetical protein
MGRTVVSAAPPSEAPQGSAEVLCVPEGQLPTAAVELTLAFAAERPIPFPVSRTRAPQDWLNQLQVVADEARELAAGNDQQAGWLLVVAMCKSGLGLVQAWVEIITVAGLISTRTAGTGADSAAPV